MRRVCERWTEGDKALAHIHSAHAGLPPCGEERALRLSVADELIEAGVAPAALMKAQGFDPTALNLLKANFNPDQPRVLAAGDKVFVGLSIASASAQLWPQNLNRIALQLIHRSEHQHD